MLNHHLVIKNGTKGLSWLNLSEKCFADFKWKSEPDKLYFLRNCDRNDLIQYHVSELTSFLSINKDVDDFIQTVRVAAVIGLAQSISSDEINNKYLLIIVPKPNQSVFCIKGLLVKNKLLQQTLASVAMSEFENVATVQISADSNLSMKIHLLTISLVSFVNSDLKSETLEQWWNEDMTKTQKETLATLPATSGGVTIENDPTTSSLQSLNNSCSSSQNLVKVERSAIAVDEFYAKGSLESSNKILHEETVCTSINKSTNLSGIKVRYICFVFVLLTVCSV